MERIEQDWGIAWDSDYGELAVVVEQEGLWLQGSYYCGRDYEIEPVLLSWDEKVKSGTVRPADIRDLVGTVQREKAAIGVFITLEKPTSEMIKEAVSAGFYHSPGWGKDYPRIQILTIEELLHGGGVKMPPQHGTFKEARRVRPEEGPHPQLELG